VNDEQKTKKQLLKELQEIRQQVRELNGLDDEHKQIKRTLRENQENFLALKHNEKTERSLRKRLTTMLEVCNKLCKADSFDDLCRNAVKLGCERLRFERLGIWFCGKEPNQIMGSFGVDEKGQLRDERDEKVFFDTKKVSREILAGDILTALREDGPLFNHKAEMVGKGTWACAGMWNGEEIIGYCIMDNLLCQQPITDTECGLLALYASALGHLCSRKRVEEELKQNLLRSRRIFEETVEALASASEQRDSYTAGHQQRVAQLICAIAEKIGLSEEEIYGIQLAGLIHDIGKIYVPAEILNVPRQLTVVEFTIIQNHCQVGYEILKIIEFPWPIAEIVLQHHERIDGSGYPAGLSKEDILLEAKILGVADVVEAMTNRRPYRPALGVEKALEEISRNRGILYDRKVVDACLEVFTKDGFEFTDPVKKSVPSGKVSKTKDQERFSNSFTTI